MDARRGPCFKPSAVSDRPPALYSWAASIISTVNSARRRARRLVKPKKSSARRKNPRVARFFQLRRKAFPSRRCASSVSSSCTSALPTVESRAAAAIPSSKVDFPDPFSPTKNVTGRSSASPASVRIAGTVKGKASSWPPRRLTEARWMALTAPTYLLREVFHLAYNAQDSELRPLSCHSVYTGSWEVWDLPSRIGLRRESHG